MMAVGRENGKIELWQPIRNGTSYWHSATIRASASNSNSNSNSSPCHSIAWMPRGPENKRSAWIYSACLDGSIAVYSVDSLRMVGKVECYGGSVWAISTVAVASDADSDESESDGMEYWMAAACEDGSIRLLGLDPVTGIPQYEGLLQQHQPGIPQHQDNSQQEQGMVRRGGRLVSVAWSSNGRMLCAGSSDGCLHVYEHKATVDSGVRQKGQLNAKASSTAVQAQWKLLGSLQVEKPLLNQSQLMDGHGSGGEEGDEPGQSACILWAVGFVSGGSHRESYRSHSAGTLSHSAASNSNASNTEPVIVASGDSRGRIVLWDVKTATVIKSVTTHQADILAMAIDSKPNSSAPSNGPSCCIYASGIDSKIVKLEFIGQASTKHSSSSSAAAQAMLVPSAWKLTWNVRMHSHDVRALALIPQASHRSASSSAAAVHSSQSLLVSAGLDCKIGIWQTGQLQESHVTVLMPVGRGFAEQTAWTNTCNSDGNTLLAAIDHHDNSVKLWSFECMVDQCGSSSAACGDQQLSWQQKLCIRLPKMGDAQQESVGYGMVVVEPENANWIAVSRGKDTLLYGINWVNQSTTNNSDDSVAAVENSIDISESGQSIESSKSSQFAHSSQSVQSVQSGRSVESVQVIKSLQSEDNATVLPSGYLIHASKDERHLLIASGETSYSYGHPMVNTVIHVVAVERQSNKSTDEWTARLVGKIDLTDGMNEQID